MKKILIFSVLLASLAYGSAGWAQQSANYQLKAYSLNAGGDPINGAAPASTNAKCVVSSIGDGLAVTGMTSTSYKASTGFPATTLSTCTLACDATVPAGGEAGAPVSFQATATPANCTGSATFAWDFGDGQSSTQQNPSHTYNAMGNYNWTMTATVQGITCSKSGTIAITITPVCQVACTASASPTSGQAPLAVNFTATATPSNCAGSPTFAWAFGDGQTSTQQNPSHTYGSAGTDNWTMTATVQGVSCFKSGTVSVTAAAKPGDCDGDGTVSIGEVHFEKRYL